MILKMLSRTSCRINSTSVIDDGCNAADTGPMLRSISIIKISEYEKAAALPQPVLISGKCKCFFHEFNSVHNAVYRSFCRDIVKDAV